MKSLTELIDYPSGYLDSLHNYEQDGYDISLFLDPEFEQKYGIVRDYIELMKFGTDIKDLLGKDVYDYSIKRSIMMTGKCDDDLYYYDVYKHYFAVQYDIKYAIISDYDIIKMRIPEEIIKECLKSNPEFLSHKTINNTFGTQIKYSAEEIGKILAILKYTNEMPNFFHVDSLIEKLSDMSIRERHNTQESIIKVNKFIYQMALVGRTDITNKISQIIDKSTEWGSKEVYDFFDRFRPQQEFELTGRVDIMVDENYDIYTRSTVLTEYQYTGIDLRLVDPEVKHYTIQDYNLDADSINHYRKLSNEFRNSQQHSKGLTWN